MISILRLAQVYDAMVKKNKDFNHKAVITGIIACSAKRRYLSCLGADFKVCCPAGATRCIDGVKFGMAEGPPCQILPHRCNDKGRAYRTPKLKFLLRFDQNVEYKRPAGADPLRDFHKIYRVCTTFQDAL